MMQGWGVPTKGLRFCGKYTEISTVMTSPALAVTNQMFVCRVARLANGCLQE